MNNMFFLKVCRSARGGADEIAAVAAAAAASATTRTKKNKGGGVNDKAFVQRETGCVS